MAGDPRERRSTVSGRSAAGAAVDAAFGLRVRRERRARDLTLRDLTDLTGIAFSQLSRIENGKGTTLHAAATVAAGLGVPLALLTGPVDCPRCFDSPAAGFTCNLCRRSTPEAREARS